MPPNTNNHRLFTLLTMLAALATIATACIAVVALIPAFGQWLYPRVPSGDTGLAPTIAIPTYVVTEKVPTASLETSIFASSAIRLSNFRVLADEPGMVRYAVDYVYNGERGPIIFFGGCIKDGKETCVTTEALPFQLDGAGRGTLRISIGLYGPESHVSTQQIFISVENERGINEIYFQAFDYAKLWTKVLPPPTAVPPTSVTR